MVRVLDLSRTLENGMPVFPGAPEALFEKVGNLDAGDAYSLIKFQMTTHVGTHVDCNSHVNKKGFFADTQGLEFFIGKGIVIDCLDYKVNSQIGIEIFAKYDISGKEFILFYTGWDKYWGQPKFWEGYPVLSDELVESLGKNIGVKGIGVDYASLDPLADPVLSKHRIFLSYQKCIIENLTNLDQLLAKDFTFMSLPLKFYKGDGSPVRAVAILELE
ncbi:MAG: cyclase family protein [Desulfitobacteriaceae bacterium]